MAGLLVTGLLSWTSLSQYQHTENRLLRLRVREAGSLITAAIPGIQTPLASAAAAADATGGDAAQFRSFMATYVGTGRQFVSASLWSLSSHATGPVVVAGVAPILQPGSADATALFARVSHTASLVIAGPFVNGSETRVGYAYSSRGGTSGYLAYAESALPANRRLRIASNSAFADLDYALYLTAPGAGPTLLATSLPTDTVSGRQSSTVIPFGDGSFTLVMKPRVPLSGTLPQRLPLLIAVIGALLSLVAAAVGERLVRRREGAELLASSLDRLADENRRLYAEQRTVAQTLQHALLPEVLPGVEGVDLSMRYVPGSPAMEIGGDWYDAIVLDEHRLMVVVGDVSGRGLRAATIMAELRYGARAYAAQGDTPSAVLTKLSRLLAVETSGHFATVLCALLEVDEHRLTVASAGHPPPIVISGDSRQFLDVTAGLPVGVALDPSYTATTALVPAGATLLAFTDGLVERRGESLDVGMRRLQDTAIDDGAGLDELLNTIVAQLLVGESEDDSAILGVRWRA